MGIAMRQESSAVAKLNLFLDVVRRRTDGYHDISTVFLPLPGIYDRITVERVAGTGISVRCNDERVPEDHSNLCWRAAAVFAEAGGTAQSWRITIDKRIPVAAGLGGGSSDAAAVLLLLNSSHGELLPPDRLAEVAASLGADVPFFLDPRPSLGEGRGDVLKEIECNAKIPLVLANPGFPCSARWAYGSLDSACGGLTPDLLLEGMRTGDLEKVATGTANVFESAVCRKFPIVEMLVEFLTADRDCLTARLTGSGPTVFAVCRDADSARRLAFEGQQKFGERFWFRDTVYAGITAES